MDLSVKLTLSITYDKLLLINCGFNEANQMKVHKSMKRTCMVTSLFFGDSCLLAAGKMLVNKSICV